MSIVRRYHQEIWHIQNCPWRLNGRTSFETDGILTKVFLAYLFTDCNMGLQFLKDIGLLCSAMKCLNCDSEMNWWSSGEQTNHYIRRCKKHNENTRCMYSRSIRYGSWFCRSNLTLLEVVFPTYDVIRKVTAYVTYLEYQLLHKTIADWNQFRREGVGLRRNLIPHSVAWVRRWKQIKNSGVGRTMPGGRPKVYRFSTKWKRNWRGLSWSLYRTAQQRLDGYR
jgi:hypothetical protein